MFQQDHKSQGIFFYHLFNWGLTLVNSLITHLVNFSKQIIIMFLAISVFNWTSPMRQDTRLIVIPNCDMTRIVLSGLSLRLWPWDCRQGGWIWSDRLDFRFSLSEKYDCYGNENEKDFLGLIAEVFNFNWGGSWRVALEIDVLWVVKIILRRDMALRFTVVSGIS